MIGPIVYSLSPNPRPGSEHTIFQNFGKRSPKIAVENRSTHTAISVHWLSDKSAAVGTPSSISVSAGETIVFNIDAAWTYVVATNGNRDFAVQIAVSYE